MNHNSIQKDNDEISSDKLRSSQIIRKRNKLMIGIIIIYSLFVFSSLWIFFTTELYKKFPNPFLQIVVFNSNAFGFVILFVLFLIIKFLFFQFILFEDQKGSKLLVFFMMLTWILCSIASYFVIMSLKEIILTGSIILDFFYIFFLYSSIFIALDLAIFSNR